MSAAKFGFTVLHAELFQDCSKNAIFRNTHASVFLNKLKDDKSLNIRTLTESKRKFCAESNFRSLVEFARTAFHFSLLLSYQSY